MEGVGEGRQKAGCPPLIVLLTPAQPHRLTPDHVPATPLSNRPRTDLPGTVIAGYVWSLMLGALLIIGLLFSNMSVYGQDGWPFGLLGWDAFGCF